MDHEVHVAHRAEITQLRPQQHLVAFPELHQLAKAFGAAFSCHGTSRLCALTRKSRMMPVISNMNFFTSIGGSGSLNPTTLRTTPARSPASTLFMKP